MIVSVALRAARRSRNRHRRRAGRLSRERGASRAVLAAAAGLVAVGIVDPDKPERVCADRAGPSSAGTVVRPADWKDWRDWPDFNGPDPDLPEPEPPEFRDRAEHWRRELVVEPSLRAAGGAAREAAGFGAQWLAGELSDGARWLLDAGCLPVPASGACPAPGVPDEAVTVVSVGRRLGVPERGIVVALVAARQESGWANLGYGDRDSLGVFQQRPSQGWGTPAEVRDPRYASARFYAALAEVDGWERMGVGAAAQAVQRSAYPGRYARHEPAARAALRTVTESCARAVPAGSEPVAVSDNPRAVAEAVAWARAQAAQGSGPGSWYRRCLNFVAQAYGWAHSGTVYAADHPRVVPDGAWHPGDRRPPVGALLFWDTGQRAGHVALYVGGGLVASTDIRRPGMVDVVPMGEVESRWGARYRGWSEPVFPAGSGRSGVEA